MSERRFADLARCHRAIDELLVRHQVALVERDAVEADRTLFLFGDSLRRHLQDEEAFLFPALGEGDDIVGATEEILLKEHARILDLLKGIETRVNGFDRADPRGARAVVALIDEEGALKRLLEHHETREESLVFPALDERVTPGRREQLIALCWIPD